MRSFKKYAGYSAANALLKTVLGLLVAREALVAQKPIVPAGGFVSSANYGSFVAPASIASVFGTNLATQTAWASSLPLPTLLAGTSVTIRGVSAPLFYVSPGQINLQVPSFLDTFGDNAPGPTLKVPLVVTTPSGVSDAVTVTIIASGIGLFTADSSGCGHASALNLNADGTWSVNSPANSIAPGGIIALFGTGLGWVNYWPPDGVASPANPPAFLNGSNATYIGRAPGLVGVDQYNTTIPSDATEMCSWPIQQVGKLNVHDISQTVEISVKKGGGQCVDPPAGSYGLLEWVKTVYSGTGPAPPPDALNVELTKGPGKKLPVDPTATLLPNGDCYYNNPVLTPTSSCQLTGVSSLNAGNLSLRTSSFGPQTFAPGTVNGMPQYSITLPSGTIQPGSLALQGTGGPDVAPFQSSILFEPFHVTSSFPPGTPVKNHSSLTVAWTGGDPDGVVWIKITGNNGGTAIAPDYTVCAVPASRGSFTVPPCCAGPQYPAPLVNPNDTNAEITVYTTSGKNSQSFSASGLTEGGRMSWRWVYTFANIPLVP
jgi:uncharacterized protein (TIGR03437 family)